MSYAPETQWITGFGPVAQPAKRRVWKESLNIGWKRKSIVAYATQHGGATAVLIAQELDMPIDSVRGQLRIAFLGGQVNRHEGMHPNGKNKIMYYSGVQ